MKARIRMVLVLIALLTAGPAFSQTWDSVYTVLDPSKCQPVASGADARGGAAFQCRGPDGYPYQWQDEDGRIFLSFGPKAGAEKAAGQTLLPFNELPRGGKIEWVFKRGGASPAAPVAAIVRFLLPAEQQPQGQVLVAYQIRPAQTCQIAYVDARANRNANELIRQAVYQDAGGFDCSQAPRTLGQWRAYAIEAAGSQGLDVQRLANGNAEYLDGAGCYYTAPGQRVVFDDPATWQYYFISDIYGSRRAWVHVDGKAHVLDTVRSAPDAAVKRGQTRVSEYRGGDVGVLLNVKVSEADEGNWKERGTMTVTRAGRKQALDVVGDCGS